MANKPMTVEQFKKLAAKPKRKSRHLRKEHYAAIFAATPARPTLTLDEKQRQRSLFERHDPVDVSLRLPLPPSVNHYWVNFVPKGKRRAVTYISPEGVAFIEAVDRAWKKHWNGWPPEPITGRIRFLMQFSMRDNRGKNNISNRIKPLEDALTKCGAWLDDAQIDDERLFAGPSARRPDTSIVGLN